MKKNSAELIKMGLLPPWVLDLLERRRDWVMARAAIREDVGKNGWHDAKEAAALKAVMDVCATYRPLAESVFAAEVELHNLRLERRKAQKSHAVYKRQRRRIAQLKRTLREHGIVIPREEPADAPSTNGADAGELQQATAHSGAAG